MNLTRACLQVIALLALAATCAAQGKRTKPANREQAPTRVEKAVIIGPESRAEASPTETSSLGKATINYLPRPNLTFVGVVLGEVYRRGEVTADLDLSFSFKGREPSKQGEVEWTFISDWDIFRRGAPLVVDADGGRFSFGPAPEMSHRGQHARRMSFADFEVLANSRQARLSVGRVSFVLTENQREALRDMLKVFERPEKR